MKRSVTQGGKWPLWLSPRQCMVVPVSDDAFEYAKYVKETLHSRGFHARGSGPKKCSRAEGDRLKSTWALGLACFRGDGTLNKKVREAQVAQFNYILVVGQQEEDEGAVNVRARGQKRPLGTKGLQEFIEELEEENNPRALRKPKAVEPFKRQRSPETASANA
eukprot:s1469_g1.t3